MYPSIGTTRHGSQPVRLTEPEMDAVKSKFSTENLNKMMVEINDAWTAQKFHVKAFHAQPLEWLRNVSTEQLQERKSIIVWEKSHDYKTEYQNIQHILKARAQENASIAEQMLAAGKAQAERTQTVHCPVCDKWARYDETTRRYYHIEVKYLENGERDESRSLWCEHPEALQAERVEVAA